MPDNEPVTSIADRSDTLVNSITEALSVAADLPEALAKVLSLVADALGLRTGWVWLTDPETRDFYGAAAQNLPPYLLDPMRMTGSTCWCIDAFQLGRLAPGNIDVMQCSRLTSAQGSEQVAATEGLRYHASIPLYFEDRPVGIMNVAAPTWRKLTQGELRVLSSVAYQVGLAVERARLAEEKARLARSEERAHMAREIHDTLAQGLAAIILHIEGALPHVETNPALARERMNKALTAAQANLEDARQSVNDLRGAPLKGKPLPEALRALARTFASETGIRVLPHVAEIGGLAARTEAELYRIAQEALTNVRRHAGATDVEICLEIRTQRPRLAADIARSSLVPKGRSSDSIPGIHSGVPKRDASENRAATSTPGAIGGKLILAVTDNGHGFDRKSVRADALGLTGIRERAKLLGGSVRIASRNGAGTRILVSIPLADSAGVA